MQRQMSLLFNISNEQIFVLLKAGNGLVNQGFPSNHGTSINWYRFSKEHVIMY